MPRYTTAQQLNRRVTIQENIGFQDSWGQPGEVWGTFARLWAHVKVATGASAIRAEAQAGGTEVSETAISIRVRWKTGITAGMRAVVGSDVYDIRAVLPDLENKRYVDLVCSAGANEG